MPTPDIDIKELLAKAGIEETFVTAIDYECIWEANLGALKSFAELVATAEREACKQAIRDTKDKSGTNHDGRNWLMRAGRSDFIAAIDAL